MGARPWILLLLVLVVAVALRFYDLGGPSLWMDEGGSYHSGSQPLSGVVDSVSRVERAPPLFYVVLHGVLQISDSELALRAPSAVAGVATVAVIFWLGLVLFGTLEGALGALLLAVSALHVLMSQDARAYSLACFFLTVSTALWMVELRTPGRPLVLALYALFALLSIYTHYLCIITVGLQWLCGVDRRALKPRLLAACVVVIGFLPWLSVMRTHSHINAVGHYPAQLTAFAGVFYVLTCGFFLNLRSMFVWYGLAWSGCALALAAPLLSPRRDERVLAVLCFGTVTAFIVGSYALQMPIFEEKYMVLVAPLFWLLAARTVAVLAGRSRPVACAVACFFVVVNCMSTANLLLHEEWHKQDWRGAVQQLARNARPGDVVLVEPVQAMPAFAYYWNRLRPAGQAVAVDAEAAEGFDARQLDSVPRVWLVESEPSMVDPGRRVAGALEAARGTRTRWATARRNPGFVITVTLYER